MRRPKKYTYIYIYMFFPLQHIVKGKWYATMKFGKRILRSISANNSQLSWHIMGAASSVDRAVPPGGSTLVLMNPDECLETKPKINSTQKPSCLSMLGDAQWNEWMGKLQHYVNQYLNEMLPFFLAPIVFLAIFGTFGLNAAGVGVPVHITFTVPAVVILLIFAGRFVVVSKNQGGEQT